MLPGVPRHPAIKSLDNEIICALVRFRLTSNLALGYYFNMTNASKAAKELARLSVAARQRKWGKEGFREKMRAWGALGGRPRQDNGKPNGD